MSDPTKNALSPYPSGSIHELLVICLPLILVAFSTQFMLFCDRLILANYSTLAMSSACNAGTYFSAYQMAMLSIAGIAEVFVGQLNGAKKYELIAAPVWQMIWFSLAISVVLIPFGFLTSSFFISSEFQYQGGPYFKYLLCCLPLHGMTAALSSFFIGRGHVVIITVITICGDILNIILDIILIFGIEGIVPSLGVEGSAIATNIAQAAIVITSFIFFLSRSNQRAYKTHDYRLNMTFLKGCLKLGFPSAAAHAMEMIAWSFLFVIVSWQSTKHAMILAVGQSIFLMFQFMSEGLSKGITAIASNLIGRGKKLLIKRCLKSAFYFHLFIMFLVAIPTFLFPDDVARLFIKNVEYEEFLSMKSTIKDSLVWIWIYLFLDGFVWVIMGILTAGGDTRFILIATSLSVWITAILPAYFIVQYTNCSLSISWKITALFGLVNAIVFSSRYMTGKWLKLNLAHKKQISTFSESAEHA